MKFHNIEHNNIQNGLGIRTVLWVSGCYHNCPECHNPITHDPDDGVDFDEASMNELLDSLDNDYVSGLTLSGGDGLCFYPVDLLDVIKEVRKKFGDTKTIWLYTGFTLESLLSTINSNPNDEISDVYGEILRNIDVLCDGPYIAAQNSKDYHWVGSTNQRVINMKESIDKCKIVFLDEEQGKLCTKDNKNASKLLIEFFNIKRLG